MPLSLTQKIAAADLKPIAVTLKDNTRATIFPVASGATSLPPSLLSFLSDEFGAEVIRGCTYPLEEPLELEAFGTYWFGVFGAVMLAGEGIGLEAERDWEKECLGTFYIKRNYPGRCSHVCNAGFLTTTAARGKGAGKAMGRAYLQWAPRLVSRDKHHLIRVFRVLICMKGIHVFGVQSRVRE